MNRVFNVCMFVICSLLLLSSCDKDPLMGSEEWEQERRNNFYDYKVKNREGFDMLSITPCAYNEDTAFLTGIKNEKMWIGMFDNHTKEQLKEWNGTKTVERTIKIDKGYGETELFNVTAFDFRSDIYKTNWGFTAALSYLHRENIAEWKGNFVNGDFNPVPISYTEGIFIDRESDYFIIRYNYQTGKDVWKTSIPSLKGVEENARINSIILEQSNSIWKYQIDITNYDGSKKQVIFTVDVETGKVTEV